jgi:hypothetical protein
MSRFPKDPRHGLIRTVSGRNVCSYCGEVV